MIQLPLPIQRIAENAQDIVAVNFFTLLIDRNQTIRIAVKSKPRWLRLASRTSSRSSPDAWSRIIIDVMPVRLCADRDHFRT